MEGMQDSRNHSGISTSIWHQQSHHGCVHIHAEEIVPLQRKERKTDPLHNDVSDIAIICFQENLHGVEEENEAGGEGGGTTTTAWGVRANPTAQTKAEKACRRLRGVNGGTYPRVPTFSGFWAVDLGLFGQSNSSVQMNAEISKSVCCCFEP